MTRKQHPKTLNTLICILKGQKKIREILNLYPKEEKEKK